MVVEEVEEETTSPMESAMETLALSEVDLPDLREDSEDLAVEGTAVRVDLEMVSRFKVVVDSSRVESSEEGEEVVLVSLLTILLLAEDNNSHESVFRWGETRWCSSPGFCPHCRGTASVVKTGQPAYSFQNKILSKFFPIEFSLCVTLEILVGNTLIVLLCSDSRLVLSSCQPIQLYSPQILSFLFFWCRDCLQLADTHMQYLIHFIWGQTGLK